MLAAVLLFGWCGAAQTLAARPQDEPFKIQWRDHSFYTNRVLPVLPGELTLAAYPDTLRGYYFVQINDRLTNSTRDQLIAAGAQLLEYVPNNAFIARMDTVARNHVTALSAVQFVGIFQPGMRLSHGLTNRIRFPVPDTLISPSGSHDLAIPDTTVIPPGPLRLILQVFNDQDLGVIQQQIESVDGTILQVAPDAHRPKILVGLARNSALALPLINGIRWIEEYSLAEINSSATPVAIFNDTAQGVMNVAPVWAAGLKGNGQTIGIVDTGLDKGFNDATMHDDFAGRIDAIYSWCVQPCDCLAANTTCDDDGAADLNSGHGTHVAGSALGDGAVSTGLFGGIAPEARLVFQAVEQSTPNGYALSGIPADYMELLQQAYDSGVRIHSSSLGKRTGGYTLRAEDIDQFVWEHPDMLVLAAAMNQGLDADGDNIIDSGSLGSPSTAKNVLTVGASENNRPGINESYGEKYQPLIRDDVKGDNVNGMSATSGRGPTTDDRIKPDLVAPGTLVVSARTQARPNIVYRSDDMESGQGQWTSGQWAQVSSTAHSGLTSWYDRASGNYVGDASASLSWVALDLSGGSTEKMLSFWIRYDNPDRNNFRILLSDTGIAGSPTAIYLNSVPTTWARRRIRLEKYGYANASNLTVSFYVDTNGSNTTGDGVYLDDVRVYEGEYGAGILSEHGLTTPDSDIDRKYKLDSGTSMATPLTAGAAALVRQYYTEREGLSYVSAALLRATLINGASEMAPGQYAGIAEVPSRPNNVEGWGRVNVGNSILPAAPSALSYVDESNGLKTFGAHEYTYTVSDSSVPVVVTMVYSDIWGPALKNNLDLSVIPPGGLPTVPPTTDSKNSVEQVRVEVPVLGDYTIRIYGEHVVVATQSENVSTQPYAFVVTGGGTLVERPAVDVMLALDVSGSMRTKSCASCEVKIDKLKEAVVLFIELWKFIAKPDDRIGANFFASTVDEFTVGTDALVPFLPNAPGLITKVQSLTAGGATAMGGSLETAIKELTDATRPRNIILFTDGMQNMNPMVDAATFVIDDAPGRSSSGVSPSTPPTDLNLDLGITVNTIGVGSTPQFAGLLGDIAAETGGISKMTNAPDDDLRQFYVEELIDVLRDYSPQLLDYRHDSLVGSSNTETFVADNTVRKIILKLSWSRDDSLTFQVVKDGTDVTSLGEISAGSYYRIFSLDLPAGTNNSIISAGGDWHMRISGEPGTDYEAAAIVDEKEFTYDFSIGEGRFVAGQPIELTARLSVGDLPLTDARISAHILSPRIGMGTRLSVTPKPARPREFQYEAAASPGQRRFQALLLDEEFDSALPPVMKPVELQSNGDGSYSALYPDTEVSGIYTVVFRINGFRTGTGTLTRTEGMSAYVRFGQADFYESELSRSAVADTADTIDGSRYLLTIRPVDRFGNYLGPDYGNGISVQINDTPVQSAMEDQLDGSYLVSIFAPAGTDPRIKVLVMDEPLFNGFLMELPETR